MLVCCCKVFLNGLGVHLSPEMKEKCNTFQWSQRTGANPDAPKVSATLCAIPESVQDMHSKTVQAAKLGYQRGVTVVNKTSEQASLWKILSVSEEKVKLEERVDGEGMQQQEVTLQILLSEWKVYKGKRTEKLPGWSFDGYKGNPLEFSAL